MDKVEYLDIRDADLDELNYILRILQEEQDNRKLKIKNPREYIWITRDYKYIELNEMKDSHLKNCIKYVERKIDNYDDFGGYGDYLAEVQMD